MADANYKTGMAIDNAINGLDGIIAIANNANGISSGDIRSAMRAGIPEATQMARGFLVSQYRKSGLKTRTGNLLKMIKKSIITLTDSGQGGVKMILAMPGGRSREEYTKASSLNYGSVRTGKDSLFRAKSSTGRKLIGEAQIRNLKSAGQNSRPSQSFRQVSRDIGVRNTGEQTKNGSAILDTTAGRVIVTKAYKFYYLLDEQIDAIKAVIFNGAMERLTAKIRGNSKLRRAA